MPGGWLVMTDTITVTLPKGNMDTIESVESRSIAGHPHGVYDLLVNDQPGRMLIDFSQFDHTEEDERKLFIAVKEGLYRYHRKSLNRKP